MLAYRLLQAQTQPEFQEVPDPHAGPGQVVVKVAGSGLCHTDFTVIARDQGYWNHDAPLSWRGRLAMIGAGGGSIPFDFFKMPPGAQLVTSLNGGSVALKEIVDLAALGRIKSLVDRYPLSAVKQAYDDFEHKRLVGRAVVIPEGSEARAA